MVSQPKKRKTVPETGKRCILSPKQLAQQHTDDKDITLERVIGMHQPLPGNTLLDTLDK
ncbi:3357_t:CDS:2 [Paraglomus brasilianum]|uniref:3357_t:CDS:1 n=1 Tax=Paraglomus brasilianum TaxID=144538 RepID=A0A9N9AV90_9GLOM|nr:3357_t:CDS:2 [Paraglomus brasilianum]